MSQKKTTAKKASADELLNRGQDKKAAASTTKAAPKKSATAKKSTRVASALPKTEKTPEATTKKTTEAKKTTASKKSYTAKPVPKKSTAKAVPAEPTPAEKPMETPPPAATPAPIAKRSEVSIPDLPKNAPTAVKSTSSRSSKKKIKIEDADPTGGDLPNESLDDMVAAIRDVPEKFSKEEGKNGEKSPAATDQFFQKSGFTESDLSLLFELGYDNELGNVIGYESVKLLRGEYRRRSEKNNLEKVPGSTFGYRGKEYTEKEDEAEIEKAFKEDRKNLIWKIGITLALTLFTLFTEIPSKIPFLAGVNEQNPALFPILGLLLLAGCVFLSRHQVCKGLKDLFALVPSPYSIISPILVAVVLYDLSAVFLGSSPRFFNLAAECILLILMFCDGLHYLNCHGVFRLLSSAEEKTVLEPMEPQKKKLRKDNKVIKVVNDEIGSHYYRVAKASQLSSFFARMNDTSSGALVFAAFLVLSVSLSLVAGFLEILSSGNLREAVTLFLFVLFATTPVFAVIGYCLPITLANKRLRAKQSAVLGNSAVEEYNHRKTVAFHDVDLFRGEKASRALVTDDKNTALYIQITSSVFRKLGGLLTEFGERQAEKDTPAMPVSVMAIRKSGVEALVQEKYHVLMGDAAFLAKSNISVPEEGENFMRTSNAVSLLYVAIDGALRLCYKIEYSVNEEFEKLASRLSNIETATAVLSFNPDLNTAFGENVLSGLVPIQVIKPGRFENEKSLSVSDSASVSVGDDQSAVYPLFAAAAVKEVQRFCFRMQLVSGILGAVGLYVLSLTSLSSYVSMLPIALYQLFWAVVGASSALFALSPASLHLRK